MNLKKLEMNKLFKELQFIKSDYEYKAELARVADLQFIQTINQILEKNQELKTIYKEKIDKKFDQIIESKNKSLSEDTLIFQSNKNNKSEKLKKLYRKVVKVTHPDKSESDEMMNFYLRASNYYEYNDILSIYDICEQLEITYEIDDEDIEIIKKEINLYKDKISFLEQSLAWKWSNDESTNKKDFVFDYIKKQIID
jgi:hypothetical protein